MSLSLSLWMLLASTLTASSSAFDIDHQVRRFLQAVGGSTGADPAAPFALSAGLAGADGQVSVQDEDSSSGGGAAVIIAVVVLVLLLLCLCLCCCIGGGCYYVKTKNGNQKEEIVTQKHVGVPYGGDRHVGYSDNHSHASTSDHMSYD
eukprot:scaffold4442_cov125-Amphora_coffeaeformis.AAC.37